MGNNYDIILIGLVAIFLILRLRAVLGKRTGNERPPARDPFAPPPVAPPGGAPPQGAPNGPPRSDAPAGGDTVVNLPPQAPQPGNAGPGAIRATVLSAAMAGATAIRAADPSFDPLDFAGGARAAFTTIVEAFAKGDTAALKPLLDAQTYGSFEAAIRAREANKEKVETTLIGFEASDIAAAELQGTIATVTVRFVTEQINATRNADGMIADGNPNEVQKVIDLWSFRRDVQSRDPNWLLVKTESEG